MTDGRHAAAHRHGRGSAFEAPHFFLERLDRRIPLANVCSLDRIRLIDRKGRCVGTLAIVNDLGREIRIVFAGDEIVKIVSLRFTIAHIAFSTGQRDLQRGAKRGHADDRAGLAPV